MDDLLYYGSILGADSVPEDNSEPEDADAAYERRNARAMWEEEHADDLRDRRLDRERDGDDD